MTDEELIEYVYRTSLRQDKPSKIKDWTTWETWIKSTQELSNYGQMAYRVSSLHNQVINRGFIQYFDNRYGIFGYETLHDLLDIGANMTADLLSTALAIVNPDNHTSERYYEYVYCGQYHNNLENSWNRLEQLDLIYYGFDEPKEAISQLAIFFRNCL